MKTRALPRVSPWFARRFTAYSRWSVRRHFHAVRVLKSALPPGPSIAERPLVVFLNHASWWDPLISLLLADAFFQERTCFAPIAADHLARYRFFRHLGFYGVSERGALGFLRTTCELLAEKKNAVWLTPQGRFMDVRERPLRFEAGLAAVAKRMPDAAFLPIAIDYTFWTEPQPEILVAFGNPIIPSEFKEQGRPRPESENETRGEGAPTPCIFEQALAKTQDALAAEAALREPSHWVPLEAGARGVNPIYDGWRWLRARWSGENFTREHQTGAVK